jgi:hypothetical protein
VADTQREWARLGAMTRLQQIDKERQAIFAAFPELRRGVPASSSESPAAPRRRGGSRKGRKLSSDARKRMSEGMRKYWARRRAAQQKPQPKKG